MQETSARDESRSMTAGGLTRMDAIGWLPCIRRGSDRWWLPRTARSSESLTRLMLRLGRAASGSFAKIESSTAVIDAPPRSAVDVGLVQDLQETLASDPALLIYCAVQIEQPQVDVLALADWLAKNALAKFSSGDAFLSAPSDPNELPGLFSDSANVGGRLQKLWEHYRILPLERWMQDARLWLEANGPPVSESWQSQWPNWSRLPTVIRGQPNPQQQVIRYSS